MTLLFMDGFDVKDTSNKWSFTNTSGGSPTPQYGTTTRFGAGFAVNFPNPTNGTFTGILRSVTASSQVFVGAAIKNGIQAGQNFSAPFHVILADSGTTYHLYLVTTSSGAVRLYRGDAHDGGSVDGSNHWIPGGTMLAASAGNVMDSGWHYVEMSATINAATGNVVVKVDGTQVISFTGNTKNGGTSTNIDTVGYFAINSLASGGGSQVGSPVIDDLYVCNTAGAVNNTFLGNSQVQTLSPNGAGSNTQLTPTGSANNWQNVSEIPDNQATFNASAVLTQHDTYALPTLAAGTGTVFAVQTSMSASEDAAGITNLKPALLISGSFFYGATHPLGTSWTTFLDVFETNPNTSAAWTAAVINAMQAGAEVA